MRIKMETSYLSLGSNIGDKLDYLKQAVKRLNKHHEIVVTKISPVYETKAWGLEDQEDFYNIAIEISTTLAPYSLLEVCQDIEQGLYRTREIHWGPRTIDIDILLYGACDIKEKALTIPHPYMLERAFVIVPLNDIAPNLVVDGVVIAERTKKHVADKSTCFLTSYKIEH